MNSNKRLRESEEREKRRQEWAARQDPELVTSKQALKILGRTNFAGFSDFMKSHDVIPIRFPGFFSSNFYVKKDVESLLLSGKINKKRGVGRPIDSYNSGGPVVTFESMQDGSWSKEDFMSAWGATEGKDKAGDLLERAPSIFKMPPPDAYHLLLILLNLGGRNFRLIGGKVDRKSYAKYVRLITDDHREQNKLLEIIHSLYGSTDIGVFDPRIIVSIFYELMKTNPKNKPSA